MAEAAQTMLSLHLAGNGCADFFPYEIFLEEGISTVYKAELTVLTGTLHTRKDLLDLLDKSATITVSQRLENPGINRKRYLHGIVTGIRSSGVFSNGKDKDCYSHVLTVEAPLARLRYNRAAVPYYHLSPVEAIRQVLEKNKLNADVSTYLEHTSYSKNLLFEQRDVSDLGFIRELLYLYGLSYAFGHSEPKGEGGLGQAELFLSEGKRYPVPRSIYSDKRKQPDVHQFDFLSSDESNNIWKMDAWSVAERIGTDGLELTAPYPNANHGSPNWRKGETGGGKRFFHYSQLFHGYERSVPTAEIDNDIMLILEARRRTLELAKSAWSGAAASLLLQPGAIVELAHFYGKHNDARLRALVTVSRLHARTFWPRNLAVSPEGVEGETMGVHIDAIEFGSGGENRFCSEPAQDREVL
jgi:uncharacterized protein involved in type VI secretion and phage assembly